MINLLFIASALLISGCFHQALPVWEQKVKKTVDHYTPQAEVRLKPYFERANIIYPPAQISLLAFKKEKHLELWAKEKGSWIFIKRYPILAASGYAGPKLAKGDHQVPEGQYNIVEFNPESRFHLSLLLDYPNPFDQKRAQSDRRRNLGNEIYIHGSNLSDGCLAIGNQAIEELFVLTYKVGPLHTTVLIVPNDIRDAPAEKSRIQPYWTPVFYGYLRQTLENYSPLAYNSES